MKKRILALVLALTVSLCPVMTADAAMIVKNNMGALDTSNILDSNKTKIPKDSLQKIAAGYKINYSAEDLEALKKRLNLSEQQITLAAPNTSMEEMSEFNIGSVALRDIDLNYSNDFVVNVPDDYVNQSGFSTVTLALDSTDLVKKDFVISDIGVVNAPATYNFNVLTQQLKVSIIGPADVMETLDASDLTANVDLLSYSTQAGAVDGDTVTFNYTPTITCSKYNTVWATGDYRVAVQGVRTSGNPTVNSEQTQSDLSENSNH